MGFRFRGYIFTWYVPEIWSRPKLRPFQVKRNTGSFYYVWPENPPRPKLRQCKAIGANCKLRIGYSVIGYREIVFLRGRLRRRSRDISRKNSQPSEIGIKNAFPGARAKTGIPKKIRKLPKFEHVTELDPVKKKPASRGC